MKVADVVVKACKFRSIETFTYGDNGDFINVRSIKYINDAFDVNFSIAGREYQFTCNLFGKFQIYNILCAVGFLVSLGFNIKKILPILNKLSDVPGRMQRVGLSNVYVDYSHKPDALDNALKSMKDFLKEIKKTGKLIVVFGCGGNRDEGKRAEMGKIANNIADIVIVTDDNPRNEDPAEIRKEIMKGCPNAIEISDREQAIKYAIQNSKSEDLVLVAGKGHEKFQLVAEKKLVFDDAEIAKKYLPK